MSEKRVNKANVMVKEKMQQALLKLIEERPFSSITVTDITLEAGVSRMSFYRNYDTIEDILTESLNDIVEKYEKEDLNYGAELSKKMFYDRDYIQHCFRFFYEHHNYLDTLINCGLGDLFLAKVSEYLMKKWTKDLKINNIEKMQISAFAGSIYNVYREWAKNSFTEKPNEIANIMYDIWK